MGFSGWVATLAGWYVTEIGRQPYIVFGQLLTRDVVASVPASHVALRSLDVRDNGIGDAGARALAAAVSRLPHLARLDAGDNPVSADGMIALLSMAPTHPSLESLRLPLGSGESPPARAASRARSRASSARSRT